MAEQTAIIIGAGPAGLTAAYELLEKTDIKPVIFEMSGEIGGLSRTVNYKGNRIDIGGHRFFSTSDRVMEWWSRILPLQGAPAKGGADLTLAYQGKTRGLQWSPDGPDPDRTDRVMLVRSRLSRIIYRRRFFDYPITLTVRSLLNLGVWRAIRILGSYLRARILPIREEKSLEDFLINRFGRELYETFFKAYTEKVWGIPCDRINPSWGAQRIKGVSILKAITHAALSILPAGLRSGESSKAEASLIDRFLYPKFGPGQMWEEVARIVRERGGEIHLGWEAQEFRQEGRRIAAVRVASPATGESRWAGGDWFFSTMPIKELVERMGDGAPAEARRVASGLHYRDFVTVGLLIRRLKVGGDGRRSPDGPPLRDNWIYVQEPDVKVGRLQIFNNWSPYLVADPENIWLGMEYFCNEGDELWSMSDEAFRRFAEGELEKIGFIDRADVLDGVVIRMKKTYPAYYGSYDEFPVVRNYLDGIENLYLIGRNGMHRYNNQDHSMLTAMLAVENIVKGETSREHIWDVNI